MWAVIIYALVWFISAAIAVGVYASGFFNEAAQALFGFFFSALFAAGFVIVLPAWVSGSFSQKC